MSDNNFHSDLFPSVPAGKVSWKPLYFQPIWGGKELVTVAVLAINDNGESWISPTINKNQYKYLFGKSGRGMMSVVEDVLEEAEEALRYARSLEELRVENKQFFLGEEMSVVGDDFYTVSKYMFQKSAFLTIPYLENEQEGAENRVDGLWSVSELKVQLKRRMLQIAPQLEHAFSRRLKLEQDFKGISIDFLGANIAANFGFLTKKNLSQGRQKCRVRLWELLVLRDFLDEIAPDEYELLIASPKASFESEDSNTIAETVEELSYEAVKEGLGVRLIRDINSAAERLASKEIAV